MTDTNAASSAGETPPVQLQSDEYAHFFAVRLDMFDGPIDLLLHLVKKNELPIEKLSLFQICSQYFECLDRMRYLDLEVAGEYLVIAATLLSIKSSILLNEPVEFVVDDEGNLVDPHQELLDRLREAAVFKESAVKLGSRDMLGLDVFANLEMLKDIESPPARYMDHDPMLLARAFKRMLERAGDKAPQFTITVDSVSIVERMMGILDLLGKSEGELSFEAVIPDATDKSIVISSFLALLELCKRGAIAVRQDENFEDIYIVLADRASDKETLVSEFDAPLEDEDTAQAG